MGADSSQLLEQCSQISTFFKCDNCGITIDQTVWSQCKICKMFDLCDNCAKLEYSKLLNVTLSEHKRVHINIDKNEPITDDCMELIMIEAAEQYANENSSERREEQYQRIINAKQIQNDYDMSLATAILKTVGNISSPMYDETKKAQLFSMIANYHTGAYERNIRVLSLVGGGVRGYMPIKVLCQLIAKQQFGNLDSFNPANAEHKKIFKEAQLQFINQLDYFVGTSTGGLIAFCLAVNYDLLEVEEIYRRFPYYFQRNYLGLGPLICAKYKPSRIHREIDHIINSIKLPNGKQLSAENATLLNIHNLLNPHAFRDDEVLTLTNSYLDNLLEFVDDKFQRNYQSGHRNCIQRERVLLITAYNTTTNTSTVFNTSYAKHWPYLIADVLKATMAAPTYFPPQPVHRLIKVDEHFVQSPESELFVDGGIFANDPEMAALWAIRMQWKKLANYHLLSIGTGCYNTRLPPSTWGGYCGWIFNKGFLINTLMDASRNMTELVMNNSAKFSDMRRMKFDYRIKKAMALDDVKFITKFDEEWETLKNGEDFKALLYFYETYIIKKQNQVEH